MEKNLIEYLKNETQRFLLFILKIVRNSVRLRDECVVVAPASEGSLGDQALFNGLHERIRSQGLNLVELLVLPGQVKQKLSDGNQPTLGPYSSSRGGGLKAMFAIYRCHSLVIIGADSLDGSYSPFKNILWCNLLDAAARVGINASVVSFSFSDSPNTSVIDRIKALPDTIKFCPRDPYSLARFKKVTCKEAVLAADLAFLMRPKCDNKDLISLVEAIRINRKNGNKLVGINVNYIGRSGELGAIVKKYCECLQSVARTDPTILFVFIAHDFREGQSDEVALDLIYQSLSNDIKHRFIRSKSRRPINSWDVKYLVGNLDFVVTGRMHLAIAALGQGVPAYGIAYKNKFQGLMKHVGLTNNLIDRDNLTKGSMLLDLLRHAIANYNDDKLILQHSIQNVKKMAKKNIAA